MLRVRTTSSSRARNSASTASTSAAAPVPNVPASISQSSPSKRRLGFSGVADMFIRLRRLEHRATTSSSSLPLPTTDTNGSSLTQTSSLTQIPHVAHSMISGPSPKSRLRHSTPPPKLRLFSTSGEPTTHPGIKEGAPPHLEPVPVEYLDNYECIGGVNASTLVRATRSTLMENVCQLGANALLDEQWQCTLIGPKHGAYKVQIRYSASATCSSKPDPRRPVALDQAKGVPGLMTITRRNDL